MTVTKPTRKPARPFFSSGPCAKPPGWDASKLQTECLGRSHRAKIGKTRLQYCIDLMREVLQRRFKRLLDEAPRIDTGEAVAVAFAGDQEPDAVSESPWPDLVLDHWIRSRAPIVPPPLPGGGKE